MTRADQRRYLASRSVGQSTLMRRSEEASGTRLVHAGCYELTARLRTSGFSLNSFKRRSASLRRSEQREAGNVSRPRCSPPFKAEFPMRITRRGGTCLNANLLALFLISYSPCVSKRTKMCLANEEDVRKLSTPPLFEHATNAR